MKLLSLSRLSMVKGGVDWVRSSLRRGAKTFGSMPKVSSTNGFVLRDMFNGVAIAGCEG